MTIADLGAVGEFVAAIVVVITLIYLSIQMRQNTTALKSSQSHQFMFMNNAILSAVIDDREVAELWMKGAENFESLDDVDKQRLIFSEWRPMSSWNHYYHMHKEGLVEDHLWNELLGIFEKMGERQSMHATWDFWRSAYDEDFRKFMDQYLTPTGRREST